MAQAFSFNRNALNADLDNSKTMAHGESESEHVPDMCTPDLYFNKLPEEVLITLLRGTSCRPQSPHWSTFLNPNTLLSVCERGGALGAIARRSVPAIAIPSVNGILEDGSTGFEDGDAMNAAYTYDAQPDDTALKVDVTTASGRRNFKGLVKQLGCQLRMLMLSFTYFWAQDVPFSDYCSNLETLVLYDKYTEFDLPAVLKACRGKLRTLDLGADFLPPRYIDGITKHCKGLCSLGLKFGEFGGPMLPLWESVGPTLRELCFGKPAPVSESEFPECTFLRYGDIHRLCMVLDTLEVRDIGFGTMSASEIIGFEHMKRLKMTTRQSCLGPEKLQEIFESCNEDIAVEARVESNIVHTLGALSHRVQVLKMNYDEVEEGLDRVANGCTMLQDLDIRVSADYAGYFLTHFLSVPKQYLRKLNIVVDGFSMMDREHNIFNQLAETVDTIESMSCFVYCISEGVFSTFAGKNKNIKSVHITCGTSCWSVLESNFSESHIGDRNCHVSPTTAEEAAVSFVTDFSRCTEIQELILNDELLAKRSQRINDAVRESKILGKSIEVFIGGMPYNP